MSIDELISTRIHAFDACKQRYQTFVRLLKLHPFAKLSILQVGLSGLALSSFVGMCLMGPASFTTLVYYDLIVDPEKWQVEMVAPCRIVRLPWEMRHDVFLAVPRSSTYLHIGRVGQHIVREPCLASIWAPAERRDHWTCGEQASQGQRRAASDKQRTRVCLQRPNSLIAHMLAT